MSSRDRLFASLRLIAFGASMGTGIEHALPKTQPLCELIEGNYNEDFLREVIRRNESCAGLAMQRLILLNKSTDDNQNDRRPFVPY